MTGMKRQKSEHFHEELRSSNKGLDSIESLTNLELASPLTEENDHLLTRNQPSMQLLEKDIYRKQGVLLATSKFDNEHAIQIFPVQSKFIQKTATLLPQTNMLKQFAVVLAGSLQLKVEDLDFESLRKVEFVTKSLFLKVSSKNEEH